ncbi:endothelin-converting enzyme 1-like [Actinia tenebrosa]|uniref:Endothelin-converting enzyme 1-like n=1 Tax=Actinia tenebrosa TaxID=6105 RepID=A0A6P8I553_ACTTE|nr:endothelin-converting enzyme 1-like [Actinia tenebrosa]
MGDDRKRRQTNGGTDGNEVIGERSSSICGPRFMAITGVLTVLLVIAVIHVATSENKKSYFDELLSTGGAIRSARYARSHDEATTIKAGGVCHTKECKKVANYIKSSLNLKSDPCTDFYDYVCGGWKKKNPIPRSSSTYSTFTKLNSQVEKSLREILNAGIKSIEGANKELMKMPSDIYHSCMDLDTIDKVGDKPVKKLIKEMGGWSMDEKNKVWDEKTWDFKKILLYIHKQYTSAGGPLFSVHISDDPVNNSRHVIDIDQAGPSLSREVYFDNKKIIKAYKQFIIDVGTLLGGGKNIEKSAQGIIDFETQLANISVPDADKIESWFHRMTVKELKKEVPEYDWLNHLNTMFTTDKIQESEELTVPALPYLKKLMKLVENTPKSVLSNYLVWNVIQDEVSFLSKPYRDARTKYRDSVLGSKGQKKRWKTCVSYTNELVGDILGAAYIRKHFDKHSKEMAKSMILEVRKAFKDNVNSLPWMDKLTKAAVSEKADAMSDEVGFPTYLIDSKKFIKKFKKYNVVIIKDNALFNNRMAILKMAHQRMLKKLRKPVDREEWPMDPQTINAMYSFNENEMIIPAAILQPPFFYPKGSPISLSFGAIGSILGHEMTHGFDNTGRKFNKKGELTAQWWSSNSLKEFNVKAECIEKQYSHYKVAGKFPINGKLTLGENIADNGGFKSSIKAYNNWLKKNGDETWKLPGLNFTNEQLFYIGFGQAYCSNSRPTEQYLATLSDHHSEEKFRVIGTLSNSYEFSEAFKCKGKSPMNPSIKCSVWSNEGPIL